MALTAVLSLPVSSTLVLNPVAFSPLGHIEVDPQSPQLPENKTVKNKTRI